MLTEVADRQIGREAVVETRTGLAAGGDVVAVVGLGYVGLPLAVEFGKSCRTIGFDLSQAKVEAYRRKVDPTGEVSGEALQAASRLQVTTEASALKEADFIIVAVPTPVDG